jgi:hypothetical protein
VKDCAEAKEQLWLPDGASLLLGALCLDAWNESMQPGDKVSLYDCHDGKVKDINMIAILFPKNNRTSSGLCRATEFS